MDIDNCKKCPVCGVYKTEQGTFITSFAIQADNPKYILTGPAFYTKVCRFQENSECINEAEEIDDKYDFEQNPFTS
jgi:hypothetical protein